MAVRVGDCPLCNVSSVMFPRRHLLRRGRGRGGGGWGWEVRVGLSTREKGGRGVTVQVKYFFYCTERKGAGIAQWLERRTRD